MSLIFIYSDFCHLRLTVNSPYIAANADIFALSTPIPKTSVAFIQLIRLDKRNCHFKKSDVGIEFISGVFQFQKYATNSIIQIPPTTKPPTPPNPQNNPQTHTPYPAAQQKHPPSASIAPIAPQPPKSFPLAAQT